MLFQADISKEPSTYVFIILQAQCIRIQAIDVSKF